MPITNNSPDKGQPCLTPRSKGKNSDAIYCNFFSVWKTQAGKSRDCHDVIAFSKSSVNFQMFIKSTRKRKVRVFKFLRQVLRAFLKSSLLIRDGVDGRPNDHGLK